MNDPDSVLTQEYRDYIALLLQYHDTLTRGAEETAEAEELRGRMEGTWERLTEGQRRSAAGLGSDLNWVRRGLAPRAKRKEQITRQDMEHLAAAYEGRQWHEVLAQLRICAAALPDAHVAYVRGNVWRQFGQPALARVFFQRAQQLDPANPSYSFLAMQCLGELDAERARTESDEILRDYAGRSPGEVVKACDLALAALRDQNAKEAQSGFRELTSVLDATVTRLRLEGAGESHPSILAMAAVLAGLCHEHLDQRDSARHCYDLGLASAPQDESLLIARGILLYGWDTEKAMKDFRRVAETGSGLVWSYFFLAHHLLCNGRYEESLKECGAALQRQASNAVKGTILEWVAICQSELGLPRDLVRATFEKALQLSPDSPSLQRNFQVFDRGETQQSTSNPWQIEEEPAVRALGASQHRPEYRIAA